MRTIIEPFRIMFRRDESYAGSPSFVPLVGSARTLAPFGTSSPPNTAARTACIRLIWMAVAATGLPPA